MAETPDGSEKTEPASGKRLSEARDKGQVSKSQDITTAAVLMIGSVMVFVFGAPMIKSIENLMRSVLRKAALIQINQDSVSIYFATLILFLAKILMPILGTIFIIVVIAEVSQVGFHFATKKFTEGLNWKSIFNPFSGIKKMLFSGRSAFELLKSLLKLAILGSIVYQVISKYVEDVTILINKSYAQIGSVLAKISLELILKVATVYILLAVADYFYQKYRFKEDMKMTKQEVKEEGKQTEGNPQVKSRIRGLMFSRMKKIIMASVKKSDVVITNPTHFAVAIKYDPENMSAPVIMAKGVDFLALHIIKIAEENDVIVYQQPPLARALYYSVELGHEIPETLFKAVAQVLAFVYQVKKKTINVR